MRSDAAMLVLLGATFCTTLFLATRSGGASDADLVDRLDALDARLERIETTVADTREEARRATRAATARRTTSARVAPDSVADAARGAAAEAGAAALAAGELDQVVAESVQRTVEEQMERIAAEKRHRGWDGKWKPPIDEMAHVLELSTAQQDTLQGVFDGARDEAFALLQTQRPDGGSLLDDFVEDLRQSEDQGKAFGRLFGAITTQKVPGRNQTYLAALGEAEERIRERVAANLDEQQARRFKSLTVDVFDVKTGYDPTGDYVKARLEEASE